MENKPISLKMLDKKKASTRFGMSLLLITSISIILFFAYMLDHSNAALYYQALLYLTGILSIPCLLLGCLLYPHTKDQLIFSDQTIHKMNTSLFKDCLCYGNGVLLIKKFKISQINCKEIKKIRFLEKQTGIHTTYYLSFYLSTKEISFSFPGRIFILDDLQRLNRLIQTIQSENPHILVTVK